MMRHFSAPSEAGSLARRLSREAAGHAMDLDAPPPPACPWSAV